MEREQIPVIGTQISTITLLFLGYLWTTGRVDLLLSDKFYVILGAFVIITGPILSQIIYGLWKKYLGFKSYDVTKLLCKGLSNEEGRKVQITFDNFWHNSENVNDKIIDYSRRRSVVCQMFLFASRILGLGSLYFFIYIFVKSINNVCDHSLWKGLLLFLLFVAIALLFDDNYKKSSKELTEIEIMNIKQANGKGGYKIFNKDYFEITDKNLESVLDKIKD